ncbi:MAG: hypothetical protein AAF989_15065, partial [Planctomycetota bacterium]
MKNATLFAVLAALSLTFAENSFADSPTLADVGRIANRYFTFARRAMDNRVVAVDAELTEVRGVEIRQLSNRYLFAKNDMPKTADNFAKYVSGSYRFDGGPMIENGFWHRRLILGDSHFDNMGRRVDPLNQILENPTVEDAKQRQKQYQRRLVIAEVFPDPYASALLGD